MDTPNERYKRAPTRRSKTPPVKRVSVSPETAKAYEKMVEDRDAKQRDYTRHLSTDNKPR